MAFLVSQRRWSVFACRLLPQTSLILSQKISERNVAVRSTRHPEYLLIYDFKKVRAASAFNKIKLQTTLLTAIASPTAFAVEQLTGFLSTNSVQSITIFGCVLTIFVHSCGFLFNNTIGYIYLKDDNDTVKFSYVNYWGNRVDMDTKINNIQTFSDNSRLLNNPWYQRIRLYDSKKTFKLYHSAAKILDYKVFSIIFGNVH